VQLLERHGGAQPDDQALVDFAGRLTLAPHEAGEAVADLRRHCSEQEVYDAIAVVGLLNFANRGARGRDQCRR
jgi:alkylhydroperoxidase family enzyme